MPNNSINNEMIIKLNEIDRIILIISSYSGLVIYFISVLFIIFYLKKLFLIKSHSFLFILINSISSLIELFIKEKKFLLFKHIAIYLSYLTQFNLVISSVNYMIEGKYIFKIEKDFSIKNMLLIKIVLLLITFPYSLLYEKYANIIKFFQYIIVMIFILYLYDYVKKNIDDLINYLKENIKDNILIPYIEPDELIRIYIYIDNLWFVFYIFALSYSIIKFFDILLIKIISIHFIITLILYTIKLSAIFSYFLLFTCITYLVNKNYNKAQIIQTYEDEIRPVEDEENENFEKSKNENRNDNNKLEEIEIDEKDNEENNKDTKHRDNIIGIDNLDIFKKNNKNNDEENEEKLDIEDENNPLKIRKYNNETDKLK